MEMLVLIGAERKKLILGGSGSLARVHEEAHTIAGSKTLEIPDLDVLEVPGSLRRERRSSTADGDGYAERYWIEDTNLETSGGGAGQLSRALLLTAARSSL
jgi:hypothetical protein